MNRAGKIEDAGRWPFWLAAALMVVAVLWIATGEGRSMIERRSLAALTGGLSIALGLALAAERMGEGDAKRRLRAWIINGLRAAALLVALPELAAQRSGVRWDEKLGVMPPESECPIFYRMPTRLLDRIYLQREGSQSWTGRPLNALLHRKRCSDDAYADEQPFEARYDRDGFRNPDDLRDWDVVVIGDSQVELGTLPEHDTITGALAESARLRVKNLGAAATGLMTHIAYLRHFGRAASCRDAMIFWCENDITELAEEWRRVKTDTPPIRGGDTHSLLLAGLRRAGQLMRGDTGRSFANASLRMADGSGRPVSFFPPVSHGTERMKEAEHAALRGAIHEFARTAHEMGMRPWLVLEPSAQRVWHGRLQFADSASPEVKDWRPNDVMDHAARICADEGVSVVDLTNALQKAADDIMVFNPILDKHLTREGARVVAETLARALAGTAR